VLDDLSRRGWLSDTRFAEQTIRAKARAASAPVMLAHRAARQGVAEDEIRLPAFRAAESTGEADIRAGVGRAASRARRHDERERARAGAAYPPGPAASPHARRDPCSFMRRAARLSALARRRARPESTQLFGS
jgi:hypothetical protein